MSQTGHRERKKQQTRDAITQAAFQLFAERGYEATTLAEVAESAGVATRTIFAYFPSKEDILFFRFEEVRDALADALAERPGGADALGTVRDFIVASVREKNELDQEFDAMCSGDETLHSHKRARMSQFQDLVAAAIADDLGVGPDDLRPHVAAASLMAAFDVLDRQDRGKAASRQPSADEIAAAIDPIVAFVRAGLEALPEPARS
jgi:AcrR family transcriptional regulator